MTATHGRRLLENMASSLGLRASRDDVIDLVLEPDRTWSGRARAEGLEVRCLAGTVWVTVEGDPEDHVLAAGEVFVACRAGRVAMMAFEPARVRVASCVTRHRDTILVGQESSSA